MWVKPPVIVVPGIAAMATLLLSGCGGASSSATSSRAGASTRSGLTVMPASGGPTTAFSFSFKAPVATGANGSTRLGYSLGVRGPSVAGAARSGCLGARTSQVPGAAKDADVSVTLDPAKLGGQWCHGTFIAQVTEVQTPVCAANAMCPQYIRVVATVARASFRVTGP